MGKKIVISLDERSIDKAIREIREYGKEVDLKVSQFIQRMVDYGVEIARQEVVSLGAFDSGELADSINGMMYSDGKYGVIFTQCDHAAFVEFGTGVVGAGNPHPAYKWEYDVNNHGEAGWVYYDEEQGRFRWTKGMPSRPFMYNTAKELEQRAVEIAREIIASV